MRFISTAEYEKVLADRNVCTEKDLAMLIAQTRYPDDTASTAQIAASSGRALNSVNSGYGRLGHAVADALRIPPDAHKKGDGVWWHFLSTGYKSDTGYVWTLRPEVREALQNLGYLDAVWHLARLTFNTNGWTAPSGWEGKSTTKDLHESEHGFGHEEWLFDFSKKTGGYQYGFVEAVQEGPYAGNSYNLRLFAFNFMTKAKFWVGTIRNCFVLPPSEQVRIHTAFYERGWMDQKADQLTCLGLHTAAAARSLEDFYPNVRFRQEDVTLFDPCPLVPDTAFFRNRPRYRRLYKAASDELADTALTKTGFSFEPSGPQGPRTVLREQQQTLQPREILQLHRDISQALYGQLAAEFGTKNIACDLPTGDGTYIDMVRKDGAQFVFYEIKTFNAVRKSIRDALGQLLEYAYWQQDKPVKELVIVTASALDATSLSYLELLRQRFRLPISHLMVALPESEKR